LTTDPIDLHRNGLSETKAVRLRSLCSKTLETYSTHPKVIESWPIWPIVLDNARNLVDLLEITRNQTT